MATYDLGENEVHYILLALETYAQKVFEESDEDLGDAGNDLMMIQGIIQHIKGG